MWLSKSDQDGCKLIDGGHFADHLDYHLSKKSIFEFESELMQAIHICYLDEIRLKMTKLEWPHQQKDGQMDRQTDGKTDGRTGQTQ